MQPDQKKYIPFTQIPLPDRRWPSRVLDKAPLWCSVDLRDGNQALVDPMSVRTKVAFFDLLCRVGFKQIEIGFPSASDIEFDACRAIIEEGHIPDDVTIQVIMQAREAQIRRSFEAVKGAREVIIHLYNPISTVQSEVVFHRDMAGIRQIAVDATRLIRDLAEADTSGTRYIFEYSPESFSGAAITDAVAIIDAVTETWDASPTRKMILDLTNTVEMCTPNTFADQVEYVSRYMARREGVVLSVHAHNDRGTGLASMELGLLAGAERAEGTLFGNGERTGNVDLATMALNLYTQGVDPCLDLRDLPRLRDAYEHFTGMHVHERHPYAGELVFTAFSGSHQDAIRKGYEHRATGDPVWKVPYLPLDPADIGRAYEPVIRINSQSGKGGAAFIMHQVFGYTLPRAMHGEFGAMVKAACGRKGAELTNAELFDVFRLEYLDFPKRYRLVGHSLFHESGDSGSAVQFKGTIEYDGKRVRVEGSGNGPIDAFFTALRRIGLDRYTFLSYHEHAISSGSDANAIAYIELKTPAGATIFGVGIESNINMASIQGVLCAINRAERG